MKMRSFVFAAILMIGSLSMHVAHATDTFDTAYRRGIMQKQSELEVELFWSLDRARGWVSRGSPKS